MLTKLIARLSRKRVERASQAYVDSIDSMINHVMQTLPPAAGEATEVLLKHQKDLEAAYEILKPVLHDLVPVFNHWFEAMNRANKQNHRKMEMLMATWHRIFKATHKE